MDFSAISRIERQLRQRGVIESVSPGDTMYGKGAVAKEMYFAIGRSGLDNVLCSLARSRLKDVNSILDMACGHGRVGRFLRAAFPNARMTFCELDRDATDFCANTFGGVGVPSKLNLCDVTFHDRFDIIWVGSLFTHIDEARTARWLRYLCECLNEDGIVVATFNGTWHLNSQMYFAPYIDQDTFTNIVTQYKKTGFGYSRYNQDIGMGDVGISICHPSKLFDLAGAIPNCRVLSYTERGWADSQDVMTIARTDRQQEWRAPGPMGEI